MNFYYPEWAQTSQIVLLCKILYLLKFWKSQNKLNKTSYIKLKKNEKMALKVHQSLHVSLKKLQGAPMELPEWSYNLSSPPTCRAFCYKKCSLFSLLNAEIVETTLGFLKLHRILFIFVQFFFCFSFIISDRVDIWQINCVI